MKKIALSFFLILIFGLRSRSQESMPPEACNNDIMQVQADKIKQESFADGFIILKEAYMKMESQYEQPVILPLTEGVLYQIVFIGDPKAKLIEIRMYDWNEKQVKYEKKSSGNKNGDVIQYYYRPKFTEYHIIKPVQVNKKKKLCGYMMILKKVK